MGDELSAVLSEKDLGALVTTVREQQKIGQTALAKRVGISRAQICRLENGKGFRLSTLRKIANALGYDVRVVLVARTGESSDKRDRWAVGGDRGVATTCIPR